jgi:hypothetical protein
LDVEYRRSRLNGSRTIVAGRRTSQLHPSKIHFRVSLLSLAAFLEGPSPAVNALICSLATLSAPVNLPCRLCEHTANNQKIPEKKSKSIMLCTVVAVTPAEVLVKSLLACVVVASCAVVAVNEIVAVPFTLSTPFVAFVSSQDSKSVVDGGE